MISREEADSLISGLTGDRVTEAYIESRIAASTFHRLDRTVTVCSIRLDNGYSVRGESACVDPANYNRDIGERLSYDDAFKKLWPLFGFMLSEALHMKRRSAG
jgi:Phage protein (N4 Gp49/phage Sf6 gene 66) family